MSNLLFESIDNKQILEPELQTWLFMTSPYQVFGIIAAYLYFVLLFGPNFMKTREPFKLKNTLLAYNFYNVVFSSIIVITSVGLCIRDDVFNNLCNKGVPAESVTAMSHISWWYFFSKIVELLDTVFFVLRKKQNQVTFLHIYHHTVMVISCWVYLKYLPGEQGIFIGIINSLVHVIMYTYYFFTSLGPQYKKYLWWKKYLTQIQLTQFVLILCYVGYMLIADCRPPKILTYYIIGNAVLFIYLFGDFYAKSYSKKKENNKTS